MPFLAINKQSTYGQLCWHESIPIIWLLGRCHTQLHRQNWFLPFILLINMEMYCRYLIAFKSLPLCSEFWDASQHLLPVRPNAANKNSTFPSLEKCLNPKWLCTSRLSQTNREGMTNLFIALTFLLKGKSNFCMFA